MSRIFVCVFVGVWFLAVPALAGPPFMEHMKPFGWASAHTHTEQVTPSSRISPDFCFVLPSKNSAQIFIGLGNEIAKQKWHSFLGIEQQTSQAFFALVIIDKWRLGRFIGYSYPYGFQSALAQPAILRIDINATPSVIGEHKPGPHSGVKLQKDHPLFALETSSSEPDLAVRDLDLPISGASQESGSGSQYRRENGYGIRPPWDRLLLIGLAAMVGGFLGWWLCRPDTERR